VHRQHFRGLLVFSFQARFNFSARFREFSFDVADLRVQLPLLLSDLRLPLFGERFRIGRLEKRDDFVHYALVF